MQAPPTELGPVAVWIVVGLLAIISALVGVVAFLFRKYLEHNSDRDKELEEWKTIALSGSKSLGELVPSVAKLTNAVEVEHRVAQEGRADDRSFRDEWRKLATEVRDRARGDIPDRPARSRGRST